MKPKLTMKMLNKFADDLMKPSAKQVQVINSEFHNMSRALKRFHETCLKNQSPIRGVTLKVLRNGETRLHVSYK